jgi:hypothetical protein
MKKLLGLSVMALAVTLVSMQEASAWSNIKLGVGASFQWQTGNNALGKCWTNGQIPGYPTNAGPAGYGQGQGQGYGQGYGHGYGYEQPHYAPPMPAPIPAPVPASSGGHTLEATPVHYYRTGYESGYYTPTYYPAPYYYGYGQ